MIFLVRLLLSPAEAEAAINELGNASLPRALRKAAEGVLAAWGRSLAIFAKKGVVTYAYRLFGRIYAVGATETVVTERAATAREKERCN